MTTEEAIKILEESRRQNRIMLESPTTFFRVAEVEAASKNAEHRIAALDMAINALRAQTDFNGTYVNIEWLKQVEAERDALKNAKLDRSLWKGCSKCTVSYNREDWKSGAAHEFRIDEDSLFFFDSQRGWEGIKIKFCPYCGKPLTEEAWAELEQRIGGNDG